MKRILLVDDDKAIRYALSKLLSKEFEVLESSGVSDALKKLETTSVDLICSDYNMQDGTNRLIPVVLHYGKKLPLNAVNENGEDMIIEDDYTSGEHAYKITTVQHNNRCRINTYYQDGTSDETFEK